MMFSRAVFLSSVEITDDGWACDDSTLIPLDGDYGDTTLGLRP